MLGRFPHAVRTFASAAFPGTKIRAAVALGPKQPFVLQDLLLEDPQAGEVKVKVVACGICHTDLVRRATCCFH